MATARSCSTSGLRRTTVRSSSVTLQMRREESAPGSEGIDRLADPLDPEAHPPGIRLEGAPVHHQPRTDIGDMLDLDQIVGLERPAAGNEIDDAPAEPEGGGKLHGAGEPDAFGLDPTGREMTPRDLGIFGRDPDMAPARRVVGFRECGRLGDREATAT